MTRFYRLEQIRHYARSDISVSLRLLRAFDDMRVAGSSASGRESLIERARRVVEVFQRSLDRPRRFEPQ